MQKIDFQNAAFQKKTRGRGSDKLQSVSSFAVFACVVSAEDDEINPAEKILFLGELFSVCGVAQQKMGNNAKARDFFHKVPFTSITQYYSA